MIIKVLQVFVTSKLPKFPNTTTVTTWVLLLPISSISLYICTQLYFNFILTYYLSTINRFPKRIYLTLPSQKIMNSSRMQYLNGLVKYVKALYDHEAEEENEITFKKGDVIVVTDDSDDSWWTGHLDGKGRSGATGQFPSNYVEPYTNKEKFTTEKATKKETFTTKKATKKEKLTTKKATKKGKLTTNKATASPSGGTLNVWNDVMKPMKLDEKEQKLFDHAMMKLRGRNVAKEVHEMLKMLDRERRGVITTVIFKTTMMGSKWHLNMPETDAIAKSISGKARILDYTKFTDIISKRLNDKGMDEKARLNRHLKLFRRVSVSGADVNQSIIRQRWTKMNAMAENSKQKREERAAELEAKRKEKLEREKSEKILNMEKARQRRERLALSHTSYRDQAKMMTAKRKKFETDEKYRQFAALRKANEVKYDNRRSPTSKSNSDELFDGKIKDFGPIGNKKPFSASNVSRSVGFGSFSSPMTKTTMRPKFQYWEKHINADGRIFFHNPQAKKSTWELPPCAILVDCTEYEVSSGESFEQPSSNGRRSSLMHGNDNTGVENHGGERISDVRGPEHSDEMDPLQSIFMSHPLWNHDDMPAFNELKNLGIETFEPTDKDRAHEHLTERLVDREMLKKGVYTRTIRYDDFQPEMLEPSPPRKSNFKGSQNSKASPRKAQTIQQQKLNQKTNEKSLVKYVKALYDHEAEEENEITFKEGDIIVVTDDSDDDWWIGYLDWKGSSSATGQFPSNYVEPYTKKEKIKSINKPTETKPAPTPAPAPTPTPTPPKTAKSKPSKRLAEKTEEKEAGGKNVTEKTEGKKAGGKNVTPVVISGPPEATHPDSFKLHPKQEPLRPYLVMIKAELNREAHHQEPTKRELRDMKRMFMKLADLVHDIEVLQNLDIYNDCKKISEQSMNKKIKKYTTAIVHHWLQEFPSLEYDKKG
jgi:hypothetical protein